MLLSFFHFREKRENKMRKRERKIHQRNIYYIVCEEKETLSSSSIVVITIKFAKNRKQVK